jgi:DNA-binding transcriptional regulator GbsR (MarR family)
VPNNPNVLPLPRLDDDATARYIDGFGVMMASFGGGSAGITFGRLWGYLMLMPGPVSLDQMAHDLEAAKSSISVAARQLEQMGVARRIPQRGSRRVLYESVETFESVLEIDNQRRALILEKIRQGVEIAPEGIARQRLRNFADLFEFSINERRNQLRRWREHQSGRNRGPR